MSEIVNNPFDILKDHEINQENIDFVEKQHPFIKWLNPRWRTIPQDGQDFLQSLTLNSIQEEMERMREAFSEEPCVYIPSPHYATKDVFIFDFMSPEGGHQIIKNMLNGQEIVKDMLKRLMNEGYVFAFESSLNSYGRVQLSASAHLLVYEKESIENMIKAGKFNFIFTSANIDIMHSIHTVKADGEETSTIEYEDTRC